MKIHENFGQFIKESTENVNEASAAIKWYAEYDKFRKAMASMAKIMKKHTTHEKPFQKAWDNLEDVFNDMEIVEGKSVNEESVNEEYVELMPEVANALGTIHTAWSEWKNGPLTQKHDIKPAQKELKGWIDRWFKANIK